MDGFVINPTTNRKIAIGSTVYQKLVNKGIIRDISSLHPGPSTPQVIPRNVQIYPGTTHLTPRNPPQAKKEVPLVSRAYSGLRGQMEKQKLSPEQKIQNIIQASTQAYDKTIKSINPDEFSTKYPDPKPTDIEQYIKEQLINNLKASGNKHLSKYL